MAKNLHRTLQAFLVLPVHRDSHIALRLGEVNQLQHSQKSQWVIMKHESMLAVMDVLIKLSERMVNKGEKERAVEILTIALKYPMNPATQKRAETLYDELEASLCPRVILDAKALADEMTLNDLLEVIAQNSA